MNDICKKAILVISFGTSHNYTRNKTIGEIEKSIKKAYPDYDIKQAFTSQIIINKLYKRDNIKIDNVKEAVKKLISDGYNKVIFQPTHIINGYEYDDMIKDISEFKDNFDYVAFGSPLLTSTKDYNDVIKALEQELLHINKADALVLVGHGTKHHSNSTYAALDYSFKDLGNNNVFIGTVEGYPDLDIVLNKVKIYNPKKVYISPLMVVAGDHAVNDIADDIDETSWNSTFKRHGFDTELILKGIGEYETIRQIYVSHIDDAIKKYFVN